MIRISKASALLGAIAVLVGGILSQESAHAVCYAANTSTNAIGELPPLLSGLPKGFISGISWSANGLHVVSTNRLTGAVEQEGDISFTNAAITATGSLSINVLAGKRIRTVMGNGINLNFVHTDGTAAFSFTNYNWLGVGGTWPNNSNSGLVQIRGLGDHRLEVTGYDGLSYITYIVRTGLPCSVTEGSTGNAGTIQLKVPTVSPEVTAVEYFVDGVSVGTATSAPFSVNVNSKLLVNGKHTTKAVATFGAAGTAHNTNAIYLVTANSLVSAGDNHSCYIKEDSTPYCWGLNDVGQLGDGTTDDSEEPVATLQTSATYISAGAKHTCVVRSGNVYCWGNNNYGQLGGSTFPNTFSSTPVHVSGITGATAVAAGESHTCAILNTGAAKCWGLNSSGQLGDGSNTSSATPTTGILKDTGGYFDKTVAISATKHTTCAIHGGTSDGASPMAHCWGSNAFGQLGIGSQVSQNRAQQISTSSNTTSIAAGRLHTCAVINDVAKCWGNGNSGAIGDGTTTMRTTPTALVPTANLRYVTAGNQVSCGATTNGIPRCWGLGLNGQLGNGANSNSLTAVTVSNFGPALAMSAGASHVCGKDTTGVSYCWGYGNYGQLGNGGNADSNVPVEVVDPR